MPKFIREYIYCIMDPSLVGKKGFFADDAASLKDIVEKKSVAFCGHVSNSIGSCDSYPFLRANNETRYKFFYCDPYWDLKCSVESGECLETYVDGEWVKVENTEDFLSNYNMSVPPEKFRTTLTSIPTDIIVSNLELAMWLAKGRGQVYYNTQVIKRGEEPIRISASQSSIIPSTNHEYFLHEEHRPALNTRVRAWGDTEWVLPTREYLGLE